MEGTTAAAVAAAARALVSGALAAQLLPLLGDTATAGGASHPMLPPSLRLYLATVRCGAHRTSLPCFAVKACLDQRTQWTAHPCAGCGHVPAVAMCCVVDDVRVLACSAKCQGLGLRHQDIRSSTLCFLSASGCHRCVRRPAQVACGVLSDAAPGGAACGAGRRGGRGRGRLLRLPGAPQTLSLKRTPCHF